MSDSKTSIASYYWLKEPEKPAHIPAARKLLLIAFAIYKSGEQYRSPITGEG